MNAIVRGPLHGEILPPGDTFTVTAAMHPFRKEPIQFEMPVGSSLDEVVNECATRNGLPPFVKGAVVEINGVPIDIQFWKRVRAKRGMHVFVRGIAKGNFFKTILMVALVVLAAFIGGPFGITTLGLGYAGAAIASTAILIGGTLLLNALFPPSKANTARDESYSIGGTRNEATPWGAVPVVFGKIKAAIKYAASPYTEFDGDDQFVRNLYAIGIGPLAITDLKIGNTPIAEFDDCEYQISYGKPSDVPQTIYPMQRVQDDYNIEVTQKDSPITRRTAEDAAEIQFDLVAPGGIVDISPKSGKKKRQVVVGTASLKDFVTKAMVATIQWDMSDNDTNPKRKTFRFQNLPGNRQYDFVLTRTTRDYDDSNNDESDNVDNITLTAVRTIRYGKPIDFPRPLATLAMRIRATKQLSGNPDEVNMMLQALAPTWDGSKWVFGNETQNCASMGLLTLMGNGIVQQKTMGEIDNASWVRFWYYCETYGFKFNQYRDFASSVYETLADILAAARAVRVDIDGRIGVSFEDPNEPVKQHFTPRNSSDFKMRITYQEMPHGLRCKFLNEKKDYAEDEKLVFFDGYTKASATLYVEVEFPGVTDPDLIYKHARYRIAEMLLRNTTYTLTADYEHMVLNRGNRAYISHDVLNEEVVAARVVKRETVGGAARVTIDQQITQTTGTTYGVRCRGKDGTSRMYNIQNTNDTTNVFTAPGADAAAYQVGDLVVFGISGQITAIYRVLKVRTQTDLRATIDFVDDAPSIMSADTGPVPPGPGEVNPPPPLADFRPYGLSALQFLYRENGAVAQITRILWKVPPGAPAFDGFLCIGTDQDGKEYRIPTNGTTLSADFVNLPTSNYIFIVQAYTADGRYTGFSEPFFLNQTLDEEKVGFDYDAYNDELLKIVQQFKEEAQADLDAAIANLQAGLEDLAKAAAGVVISEEKQQRIDADGALASILQTVQAVQDGLGARVTNEETARVNADGALASDIRTALARADNAGAAVSNEISARVSGDNVLAQQISAVYATNGQATAGGYMKLEAINNNGNGHARFQIFMNAGTVSNPRWASSGFVLEAWMDGNTPRSRFVLVAQLFIISNAGGADGEIIPFSVENGLVVMNRAHIRNLDVQNLAVNGVQFQNILDGATSNSIIMNGSGYLGTYFEVKGGRVAFVLRAVGNGRQNGIYGLYRNGSRIGGITAPLTIVRTYRTDGSGRYDETAVVGFSCNVFGDSPGEGTFLYELRNEGGESSNALAMLIINSRK